MRLSRRSFLKASAATGLGAALASTTARAQASVDDRPVPDGVPGPLAEGTWKPAGCLGCTSWCSKEVFVLDGRMIKVRGNPRSKVNHGAGCTRSHLVLQTAYDPDRIKQPMRRTNPRKGRDEDPGWEPISWDEAVGELADRILDLRARGEAHKFATMRGRYTNVNNLIYADLPKVVGSPNNISHSAICAEAEKFGAYYTQGYWNYRDYDIARADLALCWGVDPITTNRQVSHQAAVWGDNLARGMKVVTIDPRHSNTAAKSHEWLPLIPGSDAALMVAMAHEILVTGGWDREFVGDFADGANRFFAGAPVAEDEFVENHTSGLVRWWNLELKDRTPEWAEPITGIPAAQIRRAVAQMVAAAPKVIVFMARGVSMQTRGGYGAMGVHALAGLLGSIDREGGVLTGRSAKLASFASTSDYQDEVAKASVGAKKIDQRGTLAFPALKDGKSGGGVVTNRVADALLSGDPYELEVVLGYWCNFAFSSPGTARWEEALAKLPFFAHAVTHYSEMSHYADLLLPATYHFGEQMSVSSQKGNTYTHYWISERVIEPVYDVLNPETELMWLLGEKLAERGFDNWLRLLREGYPDPETGMEATNGREFETYLIKHRTRPIWDPAAYDEAGQHGDRFDGWQEFLAAGVWNSGDYKYRGLWSNMPTVTKKFEFYSETLKTALQGHADKHGVTIDEVLVAADYADSLGERAFVPHYSASVTRGDPSEYPFHFIDGKKILNREGRSANCAWYQEFADVDQGDVKWGDVVKMNPEDAARLGLADGDAVRVVSPTGVITTTLKTWVALRPGTVQKNFGQGHWGYGKNAAATFDFGANPSPKGGNNNDLLPADFERLSGSSAFYATTRVRIERA